MLLRISLTIALAAVFSIALTTTGFASAQHGSLDLAMASLPSDLDPHRVGDFASQPVLGQLHEALMEVNAYLQLEPALASGYEVSEDGLRYLFHLREGLQFHDGSPLGAQDVVASWRRALDPAGGSPLADGLAPLLSVEAVDQRSVAFLLSEPFAPFAFATTRVAVLPAATDGRAAAGTQTPLGAGPFALSELVRGSHVLLEANPHYHRAGQPGLEALRFHRLPDAAERLAGLQHGDLQLLPQVDLPEAMVLREDFSLILLGVPDLGHAFIGMNARRPPFDLPGPRQALNLALDRVELVETVYRGDAVPGGLLSPALSDWALSVSEYPCYHPDPDAARGLWFGAGWPGGLGIELLVRDSQPTLLALARTAQGQLAAAGIQLRIVGLSDVRFQQRLQDGDFDAFLGYEDGAAEPDAALQERFGSEGSANVFGYADAQVDALLAEGRRLGDQDDRQEVYAQLQRALACDGPVAVIAYPTLFSAHLDRVQGFEQMPTGGLRYLRDVELGQAPQQH